VIISRESALLEVTGDAAIPIAFEDVEGMSLAISQCVLLPDAVSLLREDAIARAKLFSWERAAEETLREIETI
ncbi:MAG: glycosyltransferase family 1 protein, partial [Patescibacteria group bacterium]